MGSWLMVHEKAVARCNSVSLSEPKKTKSTHSTEVANDWGEEGSGCRHEADEWHTPVRPRRSPEASPRPRRTSRYVAGNLVCYTRTLTFWVGHEIDGPGNASCRSPLS